MLKKHQEYISLKTFLIRKITNPISKLLASKSEFSLILAKSATKFSHENDSAISRLFERRLIDSIVELPGPIEGTSAFINKHKPSFHNI